MACHFEIIDQELDILGLKFEGELTFDEIENVIDDYFSKPHRFVLIDMSGGRFGIISRGEMVKIIERFKDPSVKHTEKSAVVADSDEDLSLLMLLKNIGKMEQIPTTYKLFRDREKAIDWLRSG
jgi:hypothetical protein